MAEPMVVSVISGVGWVVKLLEGWTNRLNKYGFGLTDEMFWVSAT